MAERRPDDAVESVPIEKVTANSRDEVSDRVAVEAPLEIRLEGRAATVVMRTPGHDEELVRGFLYNEAIIASLADIVSMTRPENLQGDERGNVLAVELSPSRKGPALERAFYSSSSCGVCGKTSIASLSVRAAPIRSELRVPRTVLAGLPAALRASQAAFRETGGAHASGLFTPAGELIALREDVGRHNALDKLVGWALGEGRIPASEMILLVSGRASFELVQKAVAAGIPLLAAVGAPSSLAVDLAEEFGVTLAGFVKPGSMNLYAHPERVT